MKKLPALIALLISALAGSLRAQTYTFAVAAFPAPVTPSTYSPGGVVVDLSGTVFATTISGQGLIKVTPNGTVSLLAGNGYGNSGTADGTGSDARFNSPRGVAIDSSGNLYVADMGNSTIRKVTPAGVVTTLAGLAGYRDSADGTGTSARFNGPQGVAVDSSGNVFVADTNNHTIRKITSAGIVTTFAGNPGVAGAADGTVAGALFNQPQGLAIDSAGNLYVADYFNYAIRKITTAGVVTTIAGLLGSPGRADGTGTTARFYGPAGIAVDSTGNMFVADLNNSTIRKISPAGVVTTIGGLAGENGDLGGTGAAARFSGPSGTAVAANGNLYVADRSLKVGTPSGQLAITVAPLSQSVAAGSSLLLSVTATGVAPLTYQWQKDGTPIAGATAAAFSIPSVQASDAGTFTVAVTNSLGTTTSSGAAVTVLAALANDNFANAQVIDGGSGSVPGRNNGATGELVEPTHVTAAATLSSVWYRWTPMQNGTAVFDASGPFTPALGVYTGTSLATLTRVGTTTYAYHGSFKATAGTTYFIAVGSYFSWERGNFTLTWRTIPNDNFANAQLIAGDTGSVTGTNDGATGESGEPLHVNASGTKTSVWYQWTPAQSGTATFETTGSSFISVLAVYTGTSLSTLSRVAQTENNQSALSRVVFNAAAGVTYYVAVGSYGFGTGALKLNWQTTSLPVIAVQPFGGTTTPTSVTFTQPVGSALSFGVTVVSFTPATYQWLRNGAPIPGANASTLSFASLQSADGGTYTFTVTNSSGSATSIPVIVTVLIPPANDNFANAATLAGLTGTNTGTNVNATGEPGEPAHWNLSGTASSVWYKWTAPTGGLAAIDTVGANFDTVLAVYTGPTTGAATFATLTRLTQDDDRGGGRTSLVSLAATSGTTYYIAVGGSTSGARGSITLNWQLSPVLAVATPPASQTIAVGGSATFSVTATGVGVTYQWNRNGVAIPGATSATLTVSGIQGGADASYTVTITNASGSVTSAPATLTVAAPALTTLAVRNTRTGGGLLWSIAAGGGTLVAVGSDGAILSSSDNGRTWTPRVSGTTNWIVGVTYGAGKFVAVADRGLILLSTDGITWTPATSSGTAQRMNNVIFADGKFVAVGEGGTILTSTDANIWTPRVSNVTTWLHGLAYNASIGHFATCGDAGVILFSSDAVTWTKLPVTGLTVEVEAIVAADSYAQFVAVGHRGTVIGIHRDHVILKTGESLVTWSGELTATGTTADLVGLATGGGALFAAGSGGKIMTATSDKGPWYSLPSAGDAILLGGLFQGDTLFLVGANETVLQSDLIFTSRLRNVSTRGPVGTGGNILISGFIVRGSGPKQVLIRAAGPTLGSTFGLSGTLAAPVLKLFDNKADVIATNTGWSTSTNATAIATTAARVGAFPFAATSADSALLATLNPGEYTVQVSGANNTTGLAIVEVYDTDVINNSGPQAVNISTRGVAGTGADKMIVGFIIDGAAARRVLIRAVGPGLATFGLTGTLAEPQVELYNGKGLLHASAAAWGLQPNADEIRGAIDAAGAFKLTDGSKDSAMVVTLLPGNWTVQVSGANSGTGVTIIEVYALP